MSEPFLDDPYFGRKVVLLCEHNDEGSFGFVLNNFVDIEAAVIAKLAPGPNGWMTANCMKQRSLCKKNSITDFP